MRSCGALNPRFDFAAKRPEIDRLGQKCLGAVFQRLALRLRIAISSDHNDRNIGPHGLRFGQEFKATHPRHVDVGQDQDDRYARRISDALKRHGAGLGKLHCKSAGAEVMPELLAEQHLDIRVIVDHEDEKVHGRSPDLAMVAAPRGRTILNSVNTPGCVSTSIEPACCLTMISWLSERPRPVPSPTGFVVKNGLNIFSFTSGGMPVPLSRILISTLSPRFLVAAARVGS